MSERARIAAIVQARMGSSRLPGKSLIPVAGAPLIWHVVHRLRRSRRIHEIVLATSTHARDDALAAWAAANGIACIRGPEDDVLGRFALAAEACDPDIIVRVNADAPLIDADFIDGMIDAMQGEHADFVMLKPGAHVAHDGVDPFSRRALRLMLDEARDDPVAREHVTGWLKQNAHRIKVALIDPPAALAFAGARLSIDTPADLAFIETVYRRLEAQAGEASLTDLIGLLRRDPALLAMNGHVRQKPLAATGGSVIIRCDGGAHLGLGHIKRCLSLARALRDREGLGVVFAAGGDAAALALIDAESFRREALPAGMSERAAIAELARDTGAGALVLDIRTDLSRADVAALRAKIALIVALDDSSERRLAAHLAVYPPVPQTRALAWDGADTDLCIGWRWTLMGGEIWRESRPLERKRETLRVLVAMGGSDPQGLTLRAVRAIAAVGRRVMPVVVIGPATPFPEAVADACQAAAPHAEIHFAPATLLPLAAECDLAVIAYGVTAHECAHIGLPAIYLGLTADHAQSARAFHESGFGFNLGIAADLDDRRITDIVLALAADPARRHAMAAAGRLAIDGRGGERLAAEIAQRLAAQPKPRAAAAG